MSETLDRESLETVRVRSGLSVALRPGWRVSDAIELRGPAGMSLSLASYPVDGSAGLATLAASDRVPGAEPVGDPRPVQIFGSDAGLVQQFESGGDGGFSQLAAYSLRGDRLMVVRTTCSSDQFEALQAEMHALMASAAIDAPVTRRTSEPPHRDAFDSVLTAFLAGAGVCELPEPPTALGQAALSAGWTAEQHERAAPRGAVPMLTGPELHAIAQLYGQPAFPGIRRTTPKSDGDTETLGRSVLMARGLVQFSSPDTIEVDPAVKDLVTQAFHAEMIVAASLSGRRGRTVTYFVGPSSTASVLSYPGRVYACRTIATEDTFGDLMAIIGELAEGVERPDRGDGPDLAAPDRDELVVRSASVDGEHVEIMTTRLVSQPDVGCFVEEPSGTWTRLGRGGAALRVLETVAG